MSGLCSEVTSEHSSTLLYLQSLNDSMLSNHLNKTQASLENYRKHISLYLIKHVPGLVVTECILHNWLWILVPIFIVTMGSIGNLLSVVVLCRRSMSHISSYIYLATLAIVDEVILLCGLFRRWIEHISNYSLENHSSSFCKLFQVIGVSSSIVSVWLIVTLTVERVLIIKRPFEASKYAKASRAKYIIILLMLIGFAISGHFFETVTLSIGNDSKNSKSNVTKTGKCEFKKEYGNFSNVWFFIDGAFYSWMPLILLIINNLIILMEIYKARNIHNSMINNNDDNKKLTGSIVRTPAQRRLKESTSRNRETKQLTVMLLVISFSFLLTTSPLVILKLLIRFKGYPDETQQLARLVLIDAVFEMLMYVNHAINFYLYCTTGNKFRQQLLQILCCRKNSKFSNTIINKTAKYFPTNSKNAPMEESVKDSMYLKGSLNQIHH